jgi:hypothetical protein
MKNPLLIIFAERASLYMRKYGEKHSKVDFSSKAKSCNVRENEVAGSQNFDYFR